MMSCVTIEAGAVLNELLCFHSSDHLSVAIRIVNVGPVSVVPVAALNPVLSDVFGWPLNDAPSSHASPHVLRLLASQSVPDVCGRVSRNIKNLSRGACRRERSLTAWTPSEAVLLRQTEHLVNLVEVSAFAHQNRNVRDELVLDDWLEALTRCAASLSKKNRSEHRSTSETMKCSRTVQTMESASAKSCASNCRKHSTMTSVDDVSQKNLSATWYV